MLSDINGFFLNKDTGKEFYEEILTINAIRLKIGFIIVLLADILLILLDINVFKPLYKNQIEYRNYFFVSILIGIISFLYLLLIFVVNKKIYKVLNDFIVLFILTVCTFLSINGQRMDGQISSYILGIFCVGSIIVINPYESAILFLGEYIFFVLGILEVDTGLKLKVNSLVSASILTILAIALANINYVYHLNNFKNRKLVLAKNEEISDLYKLTEATLEQRTKQLTEANQLLIKEINEKHKMELEVIRSQFLIEEKQKLLNEKIEYEKIRTAFFANISHEFRTPLTVIFSAQQMIALILKKSDINTNLEDINRYIGSINQNCYRLTRLIGNFIDITKIDSAYFELNLKNKDIVNIVEDITLSVATFIEDRNLNLVFDTEMEEKVLAVDEDKIERVILNLLSNSVKFTPAGGSIYVNIYDRADKVVVVVRDTGIGIPIDRQDTIFDRFVQVDKSMSRNNEGSGIGLSIVSAIVEMHKGKIILESEEGKGSKFCIELPVGDMKFELDNDKSYEESRNINMEMINIEFSDIYK